MDAQGRILQGYLGIAPRTSEAATLRVLVDLGRQCAQADEASLLVLDAKTGELVFAMTAGSRQSERTLVGQRVPAGRGLAGLAIATGEVQLGAPAYRGLRQRRRKGAGEAQPRAVLAAPMLVRGQAIGVLTAARFGAAQPFAPADAELYGKLAALAAVLVDQQQRLAALERLGKGGAAPRPRTREQRLQMDIAARVGRLTAGPPEQLERVRALLAALEAVCEGPRP